MLRVLVLLFLLVVVPACLAGLVPGDLTPFSWTGAGTYTAIGTYGVRVTAILSGPLTEVKPSSSVRLCVSPLMVSFLTGTYGAQYVNGTTYCYVNPAGSCACNLNFGLPKYELDYQQALRVLQEEDEEGNAIYSGPVLDPGQLGTYSSITIYTKHGRVIAYFIDGTVYVAQAFSAVKTMQSITLHDVFHGVHEDCPTAMPAACNNNPADYNMLYDPPTNVLGPVKYTLPF